MTSRTGRALDASDAQNPDDATPGCQRARVNLAGLAVNITCTLTDGSVVLTLPCAGSSSDPRVAARAEEVLCLFGVVGFYDLVQNRRGGRLIHNVGVVLGLRRYGDSMSERENQKIKF